jgi:hypothetical protein
MDYNTNEAVHDLKDEDQHNMLANYFAMANTIEDEEKGCYQSPQWGPPQSSPSDGRQQRGGHGHPRDRGG